MNRRIGNALALGAAVCTIAALVARLSSKEQDSGRKELQDSQTRLAARSGYIVASS